MLVCAVLPLVSCVAARKVSPPRPPAVFGVAVKESLPASFQVLNWNVHKGKDRAFKEEYRRLASGCGLLLLQEVTSRPGVLADGGDMKTVLLEGGHEFHQAEVLAYQQGFAGVATGSVARAREVRPMPSSADEPLVRLPKSALLTTYAIAGSRQRLLVANIHGLNVAGKFGVPLEGFVRQVEDIAGRVARHRGPVLWVGDFNTHDRRKKAAVDAVMRRLGLEEVLPANPEDLMRGALGRGALDLVYARGLRVSEARAVKTAGSDHAAILFKVAFP